MAQAAYQSGTKPKLVAKILATNVGFVPDLCCFVDSMTDYDLTMQGTRSLSGMVSLEYSELSLKKC